jgi:hypothetical protein|nr:putative HNH homing endonuclease [Oedogonium sp. 260-2_chl]QUO99082.1 putative HNH homing endonuclease [Oedogonium sp. 260-2_chl]
MNDNKDFETKWKEGEFWFLHFQNEYNQSFFDFIESCKNKQYSETAQMHLHHIIPKYLLKSTPEETYFCDSRQNLILISIEDHVIAHEIFAELYPNHQNKGAVDLLKGQCNEAAKKWKQAGAYASHKQQRKNQTGFWDAQKQSDRARKSMLRPDALETRSQGGKTSGSQRWLDHIITESDRYVWFYEGKEILCTINCRSGGQVLDELKKIQNIQKYPSRVSELIKGKRQSLNSWSCQPIPPKKIISNKLKIL